MYCLQLMKNLNSGFKCYYYEDYNKYRNIIIQMIKNPMHVDKKYAKLWSMCYTDNVYDNDINNLPVANSHNLPAINCLQLDYDDGSIDIDRFFEKFNNKFEFFAYTTYSNNIDNPKFRVIIPLKSIINTKIFKDKFVKTQLYYMFGNFDPTCIQSYHKMFAPNYNDINDYKYYINTINKFLDLESFNKIYEKHLKEDIEKRKIEEEKRLKLLEDNEFEFNRDQLIKDFEEIINMNMIKGERNSICCTIGARLGVFANYIDIYDLQQFKQVIEQNSDVKDRETNYKALISGFNYGSNNYDKNIENKFKKYFTKKLKK